YTIVILPSVLMILALGVQSLPKGWIRGLLLGMFCFLSVFDLFSVKRLYAGVQKTQFRELTEILAKENTENAPVFSSNKTIWHHQYYTKKLGIPAPDHVGEVAFMLDSMMQQTDSLPESFWIIGVHGQQPPDEAQQRRLSEKFEIEKEYRLFDA